MRRQRRRTAALVVALFTAVSGQAGLLLATSAPAAAIDGLVATLPAFTNVNNQTPKSLIRDCPPNTVIMGISGTVNDFGADAVRLVSLQPNSNTQFQVIAASAVGFAQQSQLGISARCAPAPAGYEIIPGTTTPSSATFQQAIARCTNNRVAIGAAARVNTTSAGWREVALQLVRTSGPMDIVRATAREDANGFAGNWSVTAYAICVNGVPGQAPAPGGLAFGTPETFVACPDDTSVHGFGGGGSTSDVTGNVWLNGISASDQTASASFTGIPADGIVAQAICAP